MNGSSSGIRKTKEASSLMSYLLTDSFFWALPTTLVASSTHSPLAVRSVSKSLFVDSSFLLGSFHLAEGLGMRPVFFQLCMVYSRRQTAASQHFPYCFVSMHEQSMNHISLTLPYRNTHNAQVMCLYCLCYVCVGYYLSEAQTRILKLEVSEAQTRGNRNILYKVTYCAGCISANTRPHQLHWGDLEVGTALCLMQQM